MSKRKPTSWRQGLMALSAIAAVVAMGVLVIPALALDTSVFELDGNAVTNNAGTGSPDDWDRVCHQVLKTDCSTSNNTAAATAVAFASQPAANGDQFSGGGSKDPLPIEGWLWNTTGGLPGKDILLNGFAARYSTAPSANCPGSSTVGKCSQIFFGMDRFDNSGDAQNGFWFLQNQIAANGAASGSSFQFTCTVPGTTTTASPCHKFGDILIVSDFSIGGGTSTITVYEWDTTCTAAGKPTADCADTNLRQISPTATNARCDIVAANAPFCGIVNPQNGTTAPWSYTDKSGNTSFLQGEFYEGGIDLSNFPGIANECFASTLAESRSSTSTSATLKSFIGGNFGACQTSVTTQSTPSGSTSIGTGSVSTSDTATITVTGAASWSGSLQFYLCGPSATKCDSTGTAIGSAITVNQGTTMPVSSTSASVTSAGTYCWAAFFTSGTSGVPSGRDTGANECFTVTPVTPTLGTAAGAGPVLLGNAVTDTATLTGTANQPGSPVINPTTAGAAAGGTITFTLFGPDSCTTKASGTGTNPQTVNVSGDGSYGPVSFTPDQVGTYHWVASYSGNLPNTNGTSHNTSCDDTGEDVTVTQIGTSTVTTPVDGSGTTVATTTFGSSVFDTAVVTASSSGGGNVTGTVSFFICDPTQTTGGVCAAGTGTQVGTAVTVTPTTGANPPTSTATSNASVTANKTGTWCFRATFTPDTSSYTGSSDATVDECFTVNDTTSAISNQNWLPNDSATVTSANGAPLNGTLTIQLYTGSTTCQVGGTAVSGQSYSTTANGTSSSASVTSTNSTFTVSASTSTSWLVTFTSTDPNVTGSSHCESTSLTISN